MEEIKLHENYDLEQLIAGKISEIKPFSIRHIATFSSAAEALQIECEEGKPYSEVYHATDKYFGLRVMRPKKNGTQTKKWICRYRDAKNKDQKTPLMHATAKNYEDARYQAMKMRRDSADRREAGMPGVPTLFKAYVDYVEAHEHNWSPATKLMYQKAEKYFLRFGHTKANHVTPKNMTDLIRIIKEGVVERYESFKKPTVVLTGEASALEVMRIVKAVYNDLMADGTVKFSPVAKLARTGYFDRPDPKTDAIHRSDLPKVWSWIHESCHISVRDYLIVALFTAFRKSLLARLSWDRVDMRNKTYMILDTDEGNKSKRKIEFPIPDWIFNEVFKKRWESPNRHKKWVIPSPKKAGKPLTSIRGSLKALENMTGVKVSTHGLRRTSATLMHASGNSDFLVARLLTHQLDAAGSRSNTAGYVITTGTDMREAMNRMVVYTLALLSSESKV